MAIGPSYTIDLAKDFGLRQKARSVVRDSSGLNRLESDIELIGPQLGHDITYFEDRFPTVHSMLTDLEWTNDEMLGRTYFWAAAMEASLFGINTPWPSRTDSLQRNRVIIPEGIWYANSEIRNSGCFESKNIPWVNFGNGGTEMVRVESVTGEPTGNWKSLYGPQQNGVRFMITPLSYPGEGGLWPHVPGGSLTWQPYGYNSNTDIRWLASDRSGGSGGVVSGRSEWAHAFSVRGIRFTGTAGNFNDNSYREAAIQCNWPGEMSLIENCYFDHFNDFGILIDGGPAPVTIRNCSFFHSGVAGIGIRGGAVAAIRIYEPSGDFNPWMIYGFRAGEVAGSPNGVAFWPAAWSSNQTAPGGNITVFSPKIEGYCDRTSAGLAGVPGKGQGLARLTGRFHLNVFGGTLYAHGGDIFTAIRVDDDYFLPQYMGTGAAGSEGNVPLDNSSIRIAGMYTNHVWNWLHDCRNGIAYACHSGPTRPDNSANFILDFNWQHQFGNSGSIGTTYARNPTTGLNVAARAATYRGYQHFLEDTDLFTWNPAGAPAWGYHPVTGV